MSKFIFNCKNNIKIAVKSVISSWREYACFFVAVLIVQTCFCVAGITYYNNAKNENRTVIAQYDHHAVLRGLNSAQYLHLLNDTYNKNPKWHIYDVIRTEQEKTDSAFFDMYISFVSPVGESRDAFAQRYVDVLSSDDFGASAFTFETTPLYDCIRGESGDAGEYIAILLLTTAISFMLLMILYKIRLNHFKFTYSIYMTFGADFKKLLGSAFWEMFVIALLTLLPAALIANVACMIIYFANGYTFGFYIVPIITTLIFSLVVSLVSVIIPIKALSRKRPVKLLIAEDNSNLVTSPRSSFNLLKKRFPLATELCSIWRYRSYFAGLILSAVIFSAIFVCGVYLSDCYSARIASPGCQFTLNAHYSGTFTPELISEISQLPDVRSVVTEKSTSASSLGSHVLLPSDACLSLSDFAVYTPKPSWAANQLVTYSLADANTLSSFETHYGYEYEGDIFSVLSDENSVIISDSMSNYRALDIKPGDRIMIAVGRTHKPRVADPGELLQGNKMLTSDLAIYEYTYREFSVAAVITNMPSTDNMTVFLPPASYSDVTGSSSVCGSAGIYADTGDHAKIGILADSLSTLGRQYGFSVVDNHADTLYTVETSKCYESIFILIFMLVFCICPVVYIFSQTLFYRKRETEFNMLRAIGAVSGEIRGLFITDAVAVAGVSGIVYTLFSLVGTEALCRLMNSKWFYYIFLPSSANNIIRYYPEMPPAAFIAGLAVTVIFAFAASVLPFFIYSRKNIARIGDEFSA